MKKIVGIIAAVAMAASVFAMDFSGGVRADVTLFDMTFTDDAKPTVLTPGGLIGGNGWGNRFQTSFSGDQAGAQFVVGVGGGWSDTKIWIQPIDMLTIRFLNIGTNINAEDMDWGSINGVGSQGVQFDLAPMDGLTFNLVLNPGYNTPWINNTATDGNGKPKNTLGPTAFYAKYSADFGTIGAAWIYSPSIEYKSNLIQAQAKEVEDMGEDPADYFDVKKKDDGTVDYYYVSAPKINKFSVGYGNTFGDIKMFADVAFSMTADSDVKNALGTSLVELAADAYAKYAKDAFSITGYVKYTNDLVYSKLLEEYNVPSEYRPNFGTYNDLMLRAKLTYQLDACGIYLNVKVNDLLLAKKDKAAIFNAADEKINMMINPGVTFNVGAAGCDLGVKIENIGQEKQTKLSVPFNVSVNF